MSSPGPVVVVAPGRPAVGGLLGVAGRHIQSRWLEALLIVTGLALGAAVLTAGVSFVSYIDGLARRQIAAMPWLRAITVRPKGINWESLFGPQSSPVQPIQPQLLEPVKITRADMQAVRTSVPGIAYVTAGLLRFERQGLRAVDDRPVGGPAPQGQARPQGPPGPATEGAGEGGVLDASTQVTLRPSTPDVFGLLNLPARAGSPFTWADYDAGRPVMAVDENLARRLFPDLEPAGVVGRTLTTETTRWTIVAVVGVDPMSSFSTVPSSGVAYVPDTALPPPGALSDAVPTLEVIPEDPAETERVMKGLQTYFDGRYGPERVQLDNPLDQLREVSRQLRAFMISAMLLASVGMVIAAINILNLFLARVVRRRRLLGLSVALGASRRLLFWQSALESVLLGAVGSVVGVALAVPLLNGLYGLIRASMSEFLQAFDMPPLGLSAGGAAAGLVSGLILSLMFGAYPAWVSARTHPAEVLRAE